MPAAKGSFGGWDANNDGIVQGAPGSGGAFPYYASIAGATAGNRFDIIQGVPGGHANVVVGYFFEESAGTRFVAFHLHIDPKTNASVPGNVLYGDAQHGAAGSKVWVSPGVYQYQVQIIGGNPQLKTPDILKGSVTAPTLATDLSQRIIEFDFHVALNPTY